MTLDCINCDFMAAKDVGDETKKRIRDFAAAKGLKIRRPNGWPDFVRRRPYRPEYFITDENDAQNITVALLAAIEVVDALENRPENDFIRNEKYPSRRGGMVVSLLTPTADCKFEWGTTKLPTYEKLEADRTVKYHNDIIAFKVGDLPKKRNVIARAFYIPFPTRKKGVEAPVFPLMLLLMDGDMGIILAPIELEDSEEGLLKGLDELGNIMCDTFKSKPSTLTVDNEKTKGLLQSFCRKCGIDFKVSDKRLEGLDEAFAMFLNPFG